MRYHALAVDYDGTLAHDGRVDSTTVAAIERLRASGRHLILVTGRHLPDLMRVFPRLDLFERVVAENGALLYHPAEERERTLADPPPPELVKRLRARGVDPVVPGRVIVATWEPHEVAALEVIHELGLELQVIFNKGAVMILPSGVNKATGLQAALAEIGLSPHNVIGIGDAENDHAFLATCECAVAVANALPAVKETADAVTEDDDGAGVVEVVDRLLHGDLHDLEPRLGRHGIMIGTRDGEEVAVSPYGTGILVAGLSGSGKSTATTGVIERLAERGYQFCLIDPEGDYEECAGAVCVGGAQRPPSTDEVVHTLEDPSRSVVVNLLGVPVGDRPAFFAGLLPRLQALRTRTGRPHWLIVDEAHHLMPASWEAAGEAVPKELSGLLLVTVHPQHVAPAVLQSINVVVAVGRLADETIRDFATALVERPPAVERRDLATGEALVWLRDVGVAGSDGMPREPFRIRLVPGRMERTRHQRKYAEGDLGPDRSFYFRGSQRKLNLRVQNLMLFVQIAQGVDEETWTHHLREGDYARWFREQIKDDDLAGEAERIASQDLPPQESRRRMLELVQHEYTAPA